MPTAGVHWTTAVEHWSCSEDLVNPLPVLLRRAMPRIGASRAESVKGGLKLGKTIAAGHQSYNLMLALQLGLR